MASWTSSSLKPRLGGGKKGQSAMEFLMTYGWSILILGVVLVAVFSLGGFTAVGQASKTCVSQTGFLCSNPIINSSGVLNVTFGQSSGITYNITSVACTNSTIPTNFIPIKPVTLKSGQTTHLDFQCQVSSKAVGTSASGTLWVTYSTPAGIGYEAKLGTFEAKVSTTSNSVGSAPGGILHSVPITLSNIQSSGTGSNFQQMLTVNSNAYSHYINSAWSNVEFTTGNGTSGSPGTLLNAWVESGASNSSSSTVVWVKIPSGIAASSNTVIYLDTLATNVMSSAGPTGEAPQLSSAYGKNDNGAQVFNFYDNFSGTTLKSQWTTANTNYIVVSNGISVEPDPYSATGFGIYTTSFTQGAGVVDMYGNIPSGAIEGGYDTVLAGLTDTNLYNTVGVGEYDGIANVYGLMTSQAPVGLTSSNPPGGKASGLTFGTTGIYSIIIPSSSPSGVSAQYNYAGTISVSSAIPTFPLNIGVTNYGSSGITLTFTWIRSRAYPPSGVMPGATYGS